MSPGVTYGSPIQDIHGIKTPGVLSDSEAYQLLFWTPSIWMSSKVSCKIMTFLGTRGGAMAFTSALRLLLAAVHS